MNLIFKGKKYLELFLIVGKRYILFYEQEISKKYPLNRIYQCNSFDQLKLYPSTCSLR